MKNGLTIIGVILQFVIDFCVWLAICVAMGAFISNGIVLLIAILCLAVIKEIIRWEGWDVTYIPTAIEAYEAIKPKAIKAASATRAKTHESWVWATSKVKSAFAKSDDLIVGKTAEGQLIRSSDIIIATK